MGISVEDAVKELQARETVFVAYSQATKLPYVTCGEETYNDQVWFFAEEETLKEYGKKKLDHAMGPNVAGVIGSAIAAGFLLAVFG